VAIANRLAKVARPGAALRGIAAVSGALMWVVWALGRRDLATFAAIGAFAFIALACLAIGATWRAQPGAVRRALHGAAFVSIGVATCAPIYFFGPISSFTSLVALMLIVLGMASRSSGALPAVTGCLAVAAIAIGNGAVFTLVERGWLPDVSLERIELAGVPTSAQMTVEITALVMLVLCFLIGRETQKRYDVLSAEVDDTVRTSAVRQALLDEARADYKLAVAAGRRGVHSGREVGAFRIGELLGGGAGEVYDAVHVGDGHRVAVLLEGEGATQTARVVETLTASRPEETQVATAPARPHATMPELAHLAGEIRGRGTLRSDELPAIVDAAAAALAPLHARGMPHLDVRPETFVRDGNGWKLLDVASASVRSSGPPGPDALRYLAPERIGGSFADARADVYGVAATLYAALTGRAPYAEIADGEVPRAIVAEMPSDPGVDAELSLVLRIGLARDPRVRYASVAELRAAVERALGGVVDETDRARAVSIPRWQALAPRHARGSTPSILSRPPTGGRRARRESTRSGVWQDTYRGKLREFAIGLIGFDVVIIPWFFFVVVSRPALYIAVVALAGQLVAAVLAYFASRRREVRWPWILVGALAMVPAYSLGLHTSAIMANMSLLFAGALFRAEQGKAADRWSLAGALILTHTALSVLVIAGVLPDIGNAPVLKAHASLGVAIGLGALTLAILVIAVVAGSIVDARYDALQRDGEAITRKAAAEEAQLANARAELDVLLEQEKNGIFSGLRIGDFQLGRLLGRGGMGEVYEATRTASGQRVALKLVRGDRVAEPHALRLFAEEADVLGRVRSPYVARVLAVGGIEEELPFLAMEFIDGRTLAELLRDRRRLSFDEVGALVRDVARGLADVHAAGVFHLDLKPQNVIHADGRWKLVDFGVARLAGAASQPWIMGTPSYMAPEQALGTGVDARADLYSLATIAYRAVAGRAPFSGKHPEEIARAALAGAPPDPRQLAAIPDDVVAVLRIGLAARVEDRFASARDLEVAFADAFAGTLAPALRRRAARLPPWRRERPATISAGVMTPSPSPVPA
jgi:serine/threonine-protein kinase